MYKSTRHTNKAWTYSNTSLRSPWTGTEDEAQRIIVDSRAKMFQMTLLRPEEYVFDRLPPGELLTLGRLVNDRIRRGCAFLRKRNFPDSLVRELPNYVIIAPKLGAVLSRLHDKSLHQVPVELHGLYHYLREYGAPLGPFERPVFSENASRIRAEDIPQVQSKEKPVFKRTIILQKPSRRPKLKKKPQEVASKNKIGKPLDLNSLQIEGDTALAFAFRVAIHRE